MRFCIPGGMAWGRAVLQPEMKTNLAEESSACGKKLENWKVPLTTPREAIITCIFYFKSI